MNADAHRLRNRDILVVEDDYFIATHLSDLLRTHGARPLGPVSSVGQALAIIEGQTVSAAILDVNLAGEPVYDVADALIARGIPFAFTSGYGRGALPDRFRDMPLLVKPCVAADILRVLDACLGDAGE